MFGWIKPSMWNVNPAKNYLFKVNYTNTRKRYEICLKYRCSGVCIVNFEQVKDDDDDDDDDDKLFLRYGWPTKGL